MNNEDTFYGEAFSRNIGLLTHEQQEKLKKSVVAIAGLGGTGGINAYTFARLGVGTFHIADMDVFNVVNINRQMGAVVENIGKSKIESIKNLIYSINPHATVKIFENGIQSDNIDEFLDGVDVAVDSIDFFRIEPRRLMFRKAREKGIYAITAGPIGYGSSVLTFHPKGISFDSYMDFNDNQTNLEQYMRFGLGITPTLIQRKYFKPGMVKWKDEKAPSLVIGTLFAAGHVATEACKVIFGEYEKLTIAPSSLHFDPYIRILRKVWVPFGNKNPIQKLKYFIAKLTMKHQGDL